MQRMDLATSSGVQWKFPARRKEKKKTQRECCYIHLKRRLYMIPEAAAPQTTPQTNGGQVTGFVSCRRIFHLFWKQIVTNSKEVNFNWKHLTICKSASLCTILFSILFNCDTSNMHWRIERKKKIGEDYSLLSSSFDTKKLVNAWTTSWCLVRYLRFNCRGRFELIKKLNEQKVKKRKWKIRKKELQKDLYQYQSPQHAQPISALWT